MLPGVLESTSVEKLKSIIKNRYGLGLELKYMSNVVDMNLDAQIPFLKNGDLCVPIISKGMYLATAIVPNGNSLKTKEHDIIAEMIQLVLEPAFYSRFLKNQSLEFERQSGLVSLPENVVYLRRNNSIDSEILSINSDDISERISFSSPLIFLEGNKSEIITKVSIHIHEIGARWAYLNYIDVCNTLNKVSDIQELGPMTLFIPEAIELSIEKQNLLLEYSKVANVFTEPLLLVGSTTRILDLMNLNQLEQGLGVYLMQNKINVDNLPIQYKNLKESLKLFLDRKAFLN